MRKKIARYHTTFISTSKKKLQSNRLHCYSLCSLFIVVWFATRPFIGAFVVLYRFVSGLRIGGLVHCGFRIDGSKINGLAFRHSPLTSRVSLLTFDSSGSLSFDTSTSSVTEAKGYSLFTIHYSPFTIHHWPFTFHFSSPFLFQNRQILNQNNTILIATGLRPKAPHLYINKQKETAEQQVTMLLTLQSFHCGMVRNKALFKGLCCFIQVYR